ncbi:MAG: hypothetical protein IKY45_04020 [Clostridia bacterium]|nr:hypothetical protein [Clostridia bacterium]
MLNDRDRLIELLEDTLHEWECDVQAETLSQIAEHLIENGVIVLPVEVGQTVWYIKGGYYRKTGLEARPIKVTEINKKWHGKTLVWGFIANGTRYRFPSIGKTVFLTKEEAEEKLNELNKGE